MTSFSEYVSSGHTSPRHIMGTENPESSCENAQRSDLANRAKGTAFEILYEPRRYPTPKPLTKQEAAKEKNRVETLARWHKKQALKNNAASNFCTPITTPEQSGRTQAIAGKAL